MPVIRVPRQHGATRAQRQFIEAAQTVGEKCLVLRMFHPSLDEGTQPRCPNWNPVYKQDSDHSCTSCYGTTFAGGVREGYLAWAIFTDSPSDEQITKRGFWAPDERQVQIEPFPKLMRHDYIVRVRSWDSHNKPVEVVDRYVMESLEEQSVRVGARFGQIGHDKIAQKARLKALTADHVIHQFPIHSFRVNERGSWPIHGTISYDREVWGPTRP